MFAAILSTVLCLVIHDLSDSEGWQSNYASAIDHVQKFDKPLFIVIDKGSSTIGKMVTEGPFLSEQVEEAISADYFRMFIDTESEEGKKLAGQFEADELPRIVVIDRSGEWQVYRKSGLPTSQQVLGVLAQYHRSKLTTKGGSTTVETRYYPQTSSSTITTCKT